MTRKLLVLAGVSLALIGLSACATAPGTAAYIGSHKFTTEQVQDASNEVVTAAERAGGASLASAEINRRQLNRLMTAELVEIAAEREGVSVTDAEVDALLRQAMGATERDVFADQLAVNQFVPPSELDDFARTVALNEKLLEAVAPGADEQAQTLAVVTLLENISTELGTNVSPRFGTWSAADISIGLPPNDISTPAASPQVVSGTAGSE